MYDHESADLSRLLYLWTMPRVVEDQREKFHTDEFFINLSRQTEVPISCPVILNGVCVRWKGTMNRNTLRGQGCIEFDEEKAQEENRLLQSEMQLLGERFRQLEQQFLPPTVSQNHSSGPIITTTVAPVATTTPSDGP